MLPCIDPKDTDFIAASVNKDDLVARVRAVLSRLDTRCFGDLATEIGLSKGALYPLVRQPDLEPKLDTLQKLIGYLAPGYEIGLVKAPESGMSSCSVPQTVWRSIPTMPGWEAKYIGNHFTNDVRKATAA